MGYFPFFTYHVVVSHLICIYFCGYSGFSCMCVPIFKVFGLLTRHPNCVAHPLNPIEQAHPRIQTPPPKKKNPFLLTLLKEEKQVWDMLKWKGEWASCSSQTEHRASPLIPLITKTNANKPDIGEFADRVNERWSSRTTRGSKTDHPAPNSASAVQCAHTRRRP